MKELSIEEKAKRYDEAIKRAKEKQAAYLELSGVEYSREDIIYIFPELADDEDEKIKEKLREILRLCYEERKCSLCTSDYEKLLTWLEKQGEQTNPYSGISFEYNGHIWGMCARDNGVDILLDKQLFKHLDEKQDEQNPADKIIERARTEKQRVLLTETNGNAHIDWDCRSLQDVKLLLKYGLEYINAQLEKQGEKNESKKIEPWTAWIGKEGEKKPADKVEPKFNVGDWVVCCNYEPEQIIGIRNNTYEMSNGDIRPINMINNNHNIRLWTIEDAKVGDVLAVENIIFIYKRILGSHIVSYCKLVNDIFEHYEDGRTCCEGNSNIHPATKEQRDLLFQKMKEAGYEWDVEKKVLEKIEQKPYWDKEDLCLIDDACFWLTCYGNTICDAEIEKINAVFKCVDSLKSLKDKHIPINNEYAVENNAIQDIKDSADTIAWSEEDERTITGISMVLQSWDSYHTSSAGLPSLIPQYISWLDSIKDRILRMNR